MHLDYLKTIYWAIRNRKWEFLVVCLACAYVALIVVRHYKTEYIAKTSFITLLPSGRVTEDSLSALVGAAPSTQLVSRQELLLFSRELFEKIQSDLPVLAAEGEPKSRVTEYLAKALAGVYNPEHKRSLDDPAFEYFLAHTGFLAHAAESAFTVTYADEDPRRAQEILQKISDALLELNFLAYTQQAQQAARALKVKVLEVQTQVGQSQKELQEFEVTNKFGDVGKEAQATYEAYFAATAKLSEALVELEKDKTIYLDLKASYDSLQLTLDNRLSGHTDESLDTRLMVNTTSYQSQLATAHQDYILGKAKYNGLMKKIESLRSIVSQLGSAIEKIPATKGKYSQLLFYHTQKVRMLDSLTQQYLSFLIRSDYQLSTIQMIEKPTIDAKSMFMGGSKIKIFACALFVGGLLSFLGFCLWFHVCGFITGGQNLRGVGLPGCLGLIPRARPKMSTEETTKFMSRAPISAAAKMLDEHMLQSRPLPQVVLFIPAVDASAASLAATSMAYGLAGQDTRICLFELMAESSFALPEGDFSGANPSLSHYLASERPDQIPAYMDSQFQLDLSQLKKTHDLIFVAVSDEAMKYLAILVSHADSVVVCCPEGQATTSDVRRTVFALKTHARTGTRVGSLVTGSLLADLFTPGLSSPRPHTLQSTRDQKAA